MKIQIQSIHFDADQKLLEFIQRKADKLETFYDRIQSAEVYLRLNKDSESKDNKVVEFKIHIPGTTLFLKEQAASFEAATDAAVESLKNKLKKEKEKRLNSKAPVPEETTVEEEVEEIE
ncbi:MAG: ribosome-associated translation inhibitor RaiA [Bacteroidota bacterium]